MLEDYSEAKEIAAMAREARFAVGRKRLNDHRAAKFIADGRKVLAMRNRGATPSEMQAAIGGSRPRMYKALRAAMDETVDPLLL